MELHVGPVSPAMRGLAANPSPDGRLGYNPRCLSRDLSPIVFTKFFTLQNLVNITIGQASNSIGSFQTEFQGRFGDAFSVSILRVTLVLAARLVTSSLHPMSPPSSFTTPW